MPNPNVLRKAAKIMEKGFKIKNRLLSPYTTTKGDITLYVLKNVSATGKKFTVLASFQNFGYDTETQQFRNRPYFEIAKSEQTFGENNDQSLAKVLGNASHIAVVPHGEVYSMKDADGAEVQQLEFTYRIYTQLTGQRFSPATDI